MKILNLITLFLLIQLTIQIDDLKPRDNNQFYQGQHFDIPHYFTEKQKWEAAFSVPGNLELFKEFHEKLINLLTEQKDLVSQKFIGLITFFMPRYFNIHPELEEEIRAISETSGIELQKIFLTNLSYSFFAQTDKCTSILVKNKQEQVILGRNLDFFLEDYFAKLNMEFNHYDENGKLIYTINQHPGFAHMVSGIKYGKFATSINMRRTETQRVNLEYFLNGAYDPEVFLKKAFLKAESYSEMVNLLKNGYLISPCYYSVAGVEKNEGIMIEKDRDYVFSTHEINDENWYIMQTNYDQESEDVDGRRTAGKLNLEKIGQENINEGILFNVVLTQFPVLHQLTISTSVLKPSSNFYKQVVWY